MADYEKLGQVFENVAQGEAPRRGRLGYIVRGEYHVVDPDDPRKFLVRFESGTHVSAFHKNRVVQKPDQPVLIINDKLGRPEILGVDPAGNEGFDTGSGNAGVGLHDHVRGSGRDFIIDTWLLKQLRASVSTAFTVAIAEGGYMWHGAVRWFTASSVDLSSYVPAGISSQRWVVIAINPTSGGLVTMAGDEYSSDSYQERYRIASIAVTQAGYIPLAAVWMRSIDTQLYNYQIEDLRFLPGSLIWYLADLYNVYDDYDYYGYVLSYDGENWVGQAAGGGGGGGGAFTDLTDTFAYSGNGDKAVFVNTGETALEARDAMPVASKTRVIGTMIHDETLGSSGAFDVSSIPSGYDRLELRLTNARGTVSAALDTVRIYFNNDTTAGNYRYLVGTWIGTSYANDVGDASNVGYVPAATADADYVGWVHIDIDEYAGAKTKIAETRNVERRASTTQIGRHGLVHWENTAAINQIQIRTDNHATDLFAAGTRLQIIGYKQEAIGGVAYSTADVSNPPSDAELDSAFGEPATLPVPFTAIVNDNDADTAMWLVVSNGTSWHYVSMTKAT